MIDRKKQILQLNENVCNGSQNQSTLDTQEESRFVLWNNSMTSEVRIGRTLFVITSGMCNQDNSFKDVIQRITERQISKINKTAG